MPWSPRSAALLLTAALLAAGCQSRPTPVAPPAATPTPSAGPSAGPSGTASPTPRATPRPTPTPRATRPPRPRPVVPRPPVRRTRVAAPRPVAPRPVVPTCPSVPPVGPATQVVLVTGAGSSATVRACRRDGGRWVSVLGTAYGHVGVHGVAPPGAKREGDGRTPSGTFALGRGFGVQGDPGVVFRWTRVDSRDVWVDDPRSSLYNTWQRTPADGRWSSAEPLDQPVAYAYAQVIDYNPTRTPGLGSAIFLHVDHGSGTAGCVSVPRAQLLALLRWERPGAVVVIR